MATTNFVDNSTIIAASWLDDVDTIVYGALTSVAGTNTITATGPASMTAYATGQLFRFIPANTNTGATTINITPSGASALGAKNIFWNGAACVGGEIRQNVPCLIYYDGTQFNLIAQGGAINNTPIGQTNTAAGSFTTVSASGTVAMNAATAATFSSRSSLVIKERTVVTTATTIFDISAGGVSSPAALVVVSGYETSATTKTFTDVVLCLSGGSTPTTIAAQELNTPQSRTYSMSSGSLQLAMGASTSYTVSVTGVNQTN